MSQRRSRGDFRDAVGAGAVRRAASSARRRRSVSTALAMRSSSVATTTASTPRRVGRAAVDVLDHRPAGDVGEDFSGEAGRVVAGGDDGDDVRCL